MHDRTSLYVRIVTAVGILIVSIKTSAFCMKWESTGMQCSGQLTTHCDVCVFCFVCRSGLLRCMTSIPLWLSAVRLEADSGNLAKARALLEQVWQPLHFLSIVK
jgi:hypothetical protein